MKTKLLSNVFMMLTVCTTWSQDTIANNWNLEFKNWNFLQDTLDTRPIPFPFWMVREIALDLEEKQQLELQVQLYALEEESFQKLIKSLEQKEQDRTLQLELMQKDRTLLELQFQAEKQNRKSPGSLLWSIRLLAALGAGILLGKL